MGSHGTTKRGPGITIRYAPKLYRFCSYFLSFFPEAIMLFRNIKLEQAKKLVELLKMIETMHTAQKIIFSIKDFFIFCAVTL